MFADWFEPFLYWTGCSEINSRDPLVTPCDLKGELFWDAWIPFSDAFELMGALLWDRRRPRLHSLRLTDLRGNVGRRGRLRSQKSAPLRSKGVTKGYRVDSDLN